MLLNHEIWFALDALGLGPHCIYIYIHVYLQTYSILYLIHYMHSRINIYVIYGYARYLLHLAGVQGPAGCDELEKCS